MIRTRNKPITGARPQYSTRPPMLQNQTDTSAQAEQLIKQPPMPFKNNASPAQIPTGVVSSFGKPKPAHTNFPGHAAVGYPNGPYQSRGGLNPVNSGNPSGGRRQAGRIATNVGPQVSAKEVRRLKQTYPGLGIGKLAR